MAALRIKRGPGQFGFRPQGVADTLEKLVSEIETLNDTSAVLRIALAAIKLALLPGIARLGAGHLYQNCTRFFLPRFLRQRSVPARSFRPAHSYRAR